LLDRQVAGLCALEDFVHVAGGAAEIVTERCRIRHQSACLHVLGITGDGRDFQLSDAISDHLTQSVYYTAFSHHVGVCADSSAALESRLDICGVLQPDWGDAHSQARGSILDCLRFRNVAHISGLNKQDDVRNSRKRLFKQL
jgi:hypothetical protein